MSRKWGPPHFQVSESRQHAHQLIDRLEDFQVMMAVRFLEFMMLDPVSRSLATAPADDEPLTEEEEQALKTSKEWFKHNQGIPHEEILAEFGLKPDDFSRQSPDSAVHFGRAEP